MNCDCIEKVNQRLADAGHNYRLATTLLFDDKMNISVRLSLPTTWTGDDKPKRKKPPFMLCTLCPFCGVATDSTTPAEEE